MVDSSPEGPTHRCYRPLSEPQVTQALNPERALHSVGSEASAASNDMDQIRAEDAGVLPESRKPKHQPYYQQTMDAWSPYLTPWKAISGYVLIGLLFIPLGIFLGADSQDVVEMRYQYDGTDSDGTDCQITNYREGVTCSISFEITEDMPGPVYVLYELTTFYQNHATYVESVYTDQLEGSTSTSSISDCSPLENNGSLVLHPCGLIANTLFNDVIELSSGAIMTESGIAWESDVDDKFVQPDGFSSTACSSGDCAECLADAGNSDSAGDTVFDGCGLWEDPSSNITYAYYYPNENETQYLYETFPEVITPVEGVTNEHFAVWMRTSGMHGFRKLYGIIEDGLSGNSSITFTVTANFLVEYYDGTKALVISTTSGTGGRNPYWRQSFVALGVAIWVLAALGAVKEYWFPRVMGDIGQLVDED